MPVTSDVPFILASASPRRRELLKSVGLNFKIIPAHVNEDYLAGESPAKHVRRLSFNKAMVIAEKNQNAWVLGADTIVVIDGIILGKPGNKAQAKKMLERLSGREHKVFTGFTIARMSSGIATTKVVQSTVLFKAISPDETNWYINCDEPYDKAGGYAIQGGGAYFIRSIRGSYTNVIGLPLCEVLEILKKFKTIKFR
ncbi:MAG: Maf family protein [Smithella sp.]|jgi:septum formation protein